MSTSRSAPVLFAFTALLLLAPSRPAAARAPLNPADVGGAIGDAWRQAGGAKGILGEVQTVEQDIAPSKQGTSGRYRNFTHGQIIQHASGDLKGRAFVVATLISQSYFRAGGTTSALGLPVDNAKIFKADLGGAGSWQPFETGLLVAYTAGPLKGQAFAVSGGFYSFFSENKGGAGWLGMPTGDEFDSNSGRRQNFEGGFIFWHPKLGKPIAFAWKK